MGATVQPGGDGDGYAEETPEKTRGGGTIVQCAVIVLSREFREDGAVDHAQRIAAQGQIAAVSIVGGQQAYPVLVGHFLTGLGAAGIEMLGVIKVPTKNSFSVLIDQRALRNAVFGSRCYEQCGVLSYRC